MSAKTLNILSYAAVSYENWSKKNYKCAETSAMRICTSQHQDGIDLIVNSLVTTWPSKTSAEQLYESSWKASTHGKWLDQ